MITNFSTKRLAFIFSMLCAILLFSQQGGYAADESPTPVLLRVRVELSKSRPLGVKDVKLATFPGGRRCAFTYTGAYNPKTVSFLTKLGLRTTVYVGPKSKPEELNALEEAGAEIAITGYPGCKGGYASLIEGNTVQECYDAVAAMRLLFRPLVKGPLAIGAVGGHIPPGEFPTLRNNDEIYGYGAVFEDAHFLKIKDTNQPYMIYLGHAQEKKHILREKSDNTKDPKNVANELIYYQIIKAGFRDAVKLKIPGRIVVYSLRDFAQNDLDDLAGVIGEVIKHPLLWHATEGEISAYEYLMRKAHVMDVSAKDSMEIEITVGLDRDLFPPFLMAPLCLEFPKDMGIKAAFVGGMACKVSTTEHGQYVDVPVQAILRDGCEMTLKTAAPDILIPSEMPVTLTIRNTSDKPMEKVQVVWVGADAVDGGPGLTVSGEAASGLSIAPKSEQQIHATARTVRGARFGLMPVEALVTATVGGEERTFAEGFEITVTPLLRVEMDPMETVPMALGRVLPFNVHVSNFKNVARFVNSKAGPCKGTVSFELPEGMEAMPPEQAFNLAENQEQTLLFMIKNDKWAPGLGRVKPMVKMEGEKDAIEVACPGTTVVRDQSIIDYKPLNDKGLLVSASYDDDTKNGSFDMSSGSKNSHHFANMISSYSKDGVKGSCLDSPQNKAQNTYALFKNVDYQEGTILFFMRRDPKVKNELQIKGDLATSWKNRVEALISSAEPIITAGLAQRRRESECGMQLRRYPGWGDKDGYLELCYLFMGGRVVYVQAPYENKKLNEWRHVAMLWSVKDRRLEIYIDGQLAGKADPGKEQWLAIPWDLGDDRARGFNFLTVDHGKKAVTCRDELYVYNRALTPEEIKANMDLVKK